MGGTLKLQGRYEFDQRPFLDVRVKIVRNHDRQREEYRVLRVDRENDHYVQEWSDRLTGEVVWRKEGRLRDPDVHGVSARRKP